MSQDQSFLTPEQQKQVFQKMKDAGLLSSDVGQPTNQPDQSGQSGVGNVDFNTLQSLIKHAANPSAVLMQEGDNTHPMDAMAQIAQKMFPQGQVAQSQPQQPTQAQYGGPQIVSNPSAPGLLSKLLGMKQQGNYIQTPAGGFLGRILGLNQNIPVKGMNMYPALKALGADKLLDPSQVATLPNGEPFVGPETYEKLRQAAMTQSLIQNRQMLNPTYTSKDQLVSLGIPDDAASALMAQFPNGVTQKEVGNYYTSERASAANTMANSRAIMAGVARLGKALQVGGFDQANKMAGQANSNLLLVQKAQALVDQITANGGVANIRQQAELGRTLAALVATNNGVVTDEGMNSMVPKAALKGFAGWEEYFTNSQKPIDFTGFLPQMQDLLTREKTANIGISNAASQLGINIMGAVGQGSQASAIAKARNASPLISGNPVPQQVTGPQTQNPTQRPTQSPTQTFTPDVLSYAQKYGITPQRALQIKQQRSGR